MGEAALRGFGLVLGSTLRLDTVRLKNTVGTQPSIGESLGVIPERVRQRIGAHIYNVQSSSALVQNERNLGTRFLDRAGFHIAAHPKLLSLGRWAHVLELSDGLVVRFGVFYTTDRKPNKGCNNKDH